MKKNTLGFMTYLLLKMNFEDIIWNNFLSLQKL